MAHAPPGDRPHDRHPRRPSAERRGLDPSRDRAMLLRRRPATGRRRLPEASDADATAHRPPRATNAGVAPPTSSPGTPRRRGGRSRSAPAPCRNEIFAGDLCRRVRPNHRRSTRRTRSASPAAGRSAWAGRRVALRLARDRAASVRDGAVRGIQRRWDRRRLRGGRERLGLPSPSLRRPGDDAAALAGRRRGPRAGGQTRPSGHRPNGDLGRRRSPPVLRRLSRRRLCRVAPGAAPRDDVPPRRQRPAPPIPSPPELARRQPLGGETRLSRVEQADHHRGVFAITGPPVALPVAPEGTGRPEAPVSLPSDAAAPPRRWTRSMGQAPRRTR